MRLIVRNVAAITKILQSGLPYDIQNRFVHPVRPGDQRRLVSTWVVPGSSDPIGVIEIEDNDPGRWNSTLLAMLLPTLTERRAEAMKNASMLRDLREIVLDGRSHSFMDIFGVNLG